jgi:hypothetical protein
VLRVEVWKAIYSSSRSVLEHVLSLYSALAVDVTSMQSRARGAAEGGRSASPRLAGLGMLLRVTVFLMDAPDLLLRSTMVVFD